AEGDLVGVLQVSADRQAGREPGDRHPHPAEHQLECSGGDLILDVRVRGDDDLADRPVVAAGHELTDAQVVWADPVDRVDGAAEHVVLPAELAGALDGDDVLGLLDDAQDVVAAARVGADPAALPLGDFAADLAEPDLALHLGERVGQALHVGGVRRQDVERDALGALRPDPGESTELVDEVLHRAFVHPASLRRTWDTVGQAPPWGWCGHSSWMIVPPSIRSMSRAPTRPECSASGSSMLGVPSARETGALGEAVPGVAAVAQGDAAPGWSSCPVPPAGAGGTGAGSGGVADPPGVGALGLLTVPAAPPGAAAAPAAVQPLDPGAGADHAESPDDAAAPPPPHADDGAAPVP